MDPIRTGALIRKLRNENGMTQRMLAGKLGVSEQAVSKWERGLGCPDVSLLRDLAQRNLPLIGDALAQIVNVVQRQME